MQKSVNRWKPHKLHRPLKRYMKNSLKNFLKLQNILDLWKRG